MNIDDLIQNLELLPHPEGGYYKRTFASQDSFVPEGRDQERAIASAIFYLLSGKDFSAWHRIQSDEMWHHYSGCGVHIHAIDEAGVLTTHVLDDPITNPNASPQVLVERNQWFCAKPLNPESYSLSGCTVSPGFDFEDFEMGDRAQLLEQFPEHETMILAFTRVSS